MPECILLVILSFRHYSRSVSVIHRRLQVAMLEDAPAVFPSSERMLSDDIQGGGRASPR
jgi:hypothetical protein